MFSKTTLNFSQLFDCILKKGPDNSVNNRIAVKRKIHSIDLLLAFLKYLIVCNDSNYAFNSVYEKNIDFLKNVRLHSQNSA